MGDTDHAKTGIVITGLVKNFGEFRAVDDLSFRAEGGRVFGLLGPNGAGKSTAIGCISGLTKPTSGMITVNDHDIVREPRAAKRRLGVVPQELAIYPDLPARDNLRYWGAAFGLRGEELGQRVDDVLETIGLVDRAGDLPRTFSGGMQRRLNFGCGIVHEPTVILLDEPTVGVDPQSRERLYELVTEQRDQGACILYTTHYMEEAERLCDEIAIMDHGRMIAHGSLAELRQTAGEHDHLTLTGHFPVEEVRPVIDAISEPHRLLEVLLAEPNQLVIAAHEASTRLPAIFRALEGAGARVSETTLRRPNLETLFIKLTGKELRA